ncbi:unnamed protein product [Mycena citricolor]|uniref:Peptidase S53 domain-containing protein n=1 Tax=Mycena citricolor TaxID=2018698 RepID=A0AAD2HPF4_9AGAR|nr:unnamed protein product [Mycena citricolor]CAK5279165.1 unnamed protein product [Mycena citricolor]
MAFQDTHIRPGKLASTARARRSDRPTMLCLAFLTAALTLAAATPASDSLVVHETRAAAPQGFVAGGAAPAGKTLTLKLNLAQNDLAGLESRLLAAATPGSPAYGQWLSKEEVESFSSPTAETTAAVSAWLSSNGLESNQVSAAGDWISIDVPVSKANELLGADYQVFTHSASGQQTIRTLSYSIPASLKSHLKVVTPTTSFSTPQHRMLAEVKDAGAEVEARAVSSDHITNPDNPLSCETLMTPRCLMAMYNIPKTPAKNKTGSIAVTAFGLEYANDLDLFNFLKERRPDMNPNTTFGFISVDGGLDDQTNDVAGVEGNLDIQYTVGIATDVPINFVSVGTTTADGVYEGFLDVINSQLNLTAPSQVMTTSYGFPAEEFMSFPLTSALCDSYLQLTARGVSLLFASGDGGVAASPALLCNPGDPFEVSFPTCPYVTMVGGTSGYPEVAANLSAGGFSNYFPRQPWQESAVSSYLSALGSEYAGLYNASGRAFPDIAAGSVNMTMITDSIHFPDSGTSFSSPIVASVIALINDRLLAAGRPVLGFLNPWLYANPQMFHDIKTGSNPGCGTDGFPATAGWDPVTGLGTPDFPAMLKAAGLKH